MHEDKFAGRRTSAGFVSFRWNGHGTAAARNGLTWPNTSDSRRGILKPVSSLASLLTHTTGPLKMNVSAGGRHRFDDSGHHPRNYRRMHQKATAAKVHDRSAGDCEHNGALIGGT